MRTHETWRETEGKDWLKTSWGCCQEMVNKHNQPLDVPQRDVFHEGKLSLCLPISVSCKPLSGRKHFEEMDREMAPIKTEEERHFEKLERF